MKRSIVVNENNQRSNSTLVSKSLGSLIKIDSISIDLASDMDKNDTGKCERFSIRGYVAEMRKKDWRICLPFALDDNNKSEKQTSMLPPLHVAKFRWWRCQNCLQETDATSAAEEIGIVPNFCELGFISSSSCSHLQSHGDAVMVLSDVRQASKMDNFEGTMADFNTYANVNTDEHCFSSCRYEKEMKSVNGNSTADIGLENGSEDGGKREYSNPSDVTKLNPFLLEERHTDGTVLKSKGNGLEEYCEPNCGSHEINNIVPDIDTLNCTGRSSAEIFQKGNLTPSNDHRRNVSTACKKTEVIGKIDEAMDAVKDQRTRIPSLELEGCDNISSESDEILAGTSSYDQHHNNSSGLISRKTQKMRLLTELFDAKQNAENNQIRTEGASYNVIPCASAGLNALSAPQNHVPIERHLKKGFRGTKRKAKIPRDEDWKPVEMSHPNNTTKKVRVSKADADTTKMSIEINLEEDASAGAILQTDAKSHLSKHRINRSPTQGRKKNKETKAGDGYYPLVPWRGVVPRKSQLEIGDTDLCGAAADIGLPKSAHDSLTSRGRQLCLESYLSPEKTERNLSFCKMKNKLPEIDDEYLNVKRNSMPGEGSIIRKDVEIMQTGPEGVKLQWVSDASAKSGLDLSLNNYTAVQSKGINYFAQTHDGVDPLMAHQKGITREENWRGKDVMYVGETSRPHKFGPDPSFDKGLVCDLNEKITHRTSFLHEMQNCNPLVKDGNSPLHQKMDISDTCNNKETTEVQKHSEVMKKPSNQSSDKVSEQGSLEDIPMDIVELMAKNQYDRIHESERDCCLSARTTDKSNAEIMFFPEVHGNIVLASVHEGNPNKRKPPSGNARNGVITAGENVGPSKKNSVNSFCQINRNHFNMGKLEGNPAFMGFNTFSQHQEKLSDGIQFSAYNSIRNSGTRNCKWKGRNMVHRSSSTNIQVLELCNTCQYGLRQNEEAEHARSSMIPNHILFGNIPQKCATQSSCMERNSECPVTLQKGKMIEDIDMNFMNLSASNLEKQSRTFGSESIRRMSAKHPFICKHGGIELRTEGIGSLDLYPNETIPAMQLLSLMDAGVQSSTPFNLDGKPKFFNKPFFPCDHHPNVGLDAKSKFLEKPFLPCDHHPKEFSVIGTGVYKASDSSRYPSSAFSGKNRPSEKSCGCSLGVGAFASLRQNDGCVKSASDFTGRVSSKSQEQEREKILYSPMQNRGRRSQKSKCKSGVAAVKNCTNPVWAKKNGFVCAPDYVVCPLECLRIEDSKKHKDLEAHCVNGVVPSMKIISKIDICSVNRNPADFSIPEAGNVYMISGEDLKFGKKISCKDKSGLINGDGRKRQRNPVDFSIPEAGNVYMITGQDPKFGKKITSKDKSGLINEDGRKRQRNPTGFSISEAGKVYMIKGQDPKVGKKITSKYKSGLINVDGRKRQRRTKLTSMKEHPQHHIS